MFPFFLNTRYMKVYLRRYFALAAFLCILFFLKPYCHSIFESLKKFHLYDSVELEYQITSAFIEKKIKTLKYRVT